MSANDLLIWMSARVEGSWQQFRSAVEALHVEEETGEDGESGDDATANDLPLYQAVRLGLERLAHVEFTSTSTERRWRVVPPSLAVNRSPDRSVGILCGARSPGLVAALSQLPERVSLDSLVAPGMPDCLRLVCHDSEALHRTGRSLDLLVQPNAPAALLAAIPPIDDPRSRFPADPPASPGWTVHVFSTNTLRWKAAELRHLRSARTGLFRLQLRYQRFYFLRWRGRTFRVPVQVGKYAVLRHRRVRRLLQYDRGRALLSVPVSCRPPLLIERALVLSTGLLPHFEKASGRLEYPGVPPKIAGLAADLLRQEIQTR